MNVMVDCQGSQQYRRPAADGNLPGHHIGSDAAMASASRTTALGSNDVGVVASGPGWDASPIRVARRPYRALRNGLVVR